MSRRRSSIAALTGLIAVVVTACGSGNTPSSHAATARANTPSSSPTAKPTPAPPPPLAAPLLVQIENQADARPQSGLSVADVVYEYETEGGISRFSAMYFNPPASGVQIGPVRSARISTITLTSIYDATLLYSGGSAFVYNTLATSTLRQFNEGASQGALYRINFRVAPHNLYTDGAHVAALEQRVGAHTVKYQIWPTRTPQQGLPPGGTLATRFTVPVSQSEVPAYTYDTSTGGYIRTEPDTGVLNEADAGLPWEPRNIVVLPMSVTPRPDDVESENGTLGLQFGIQGSGDGQLAVGGQLYPIKWAQGGYGPPTLTLANGAPAPIAPGQVLFELVGSGKTVAVG